MIKVPLETFPELQTASTRLRQLALHDAEFLFRIFSDPEVTKYYELDPFLSVADARALIATERARYDQGLAIRWAITLSESDMTVGTCGLVFDHDNQSAEIGYDLARAYWGHGLMTDVLTIVIRFAFGSLEINRLWGLVLAQNMASIRLLENLGFHYEGTLRDFSRFKGKFHNMESYSLLKSDQLN